MKNVYLIITLVLILSFLLMPLLAVEKKVDSSITSSGGTSSIEEKSNSKLQAVENFKVYIPEEEKTITLSAEEYILGVVSAEMPALYHEEALKAQAIAAYTYAYRKYLQNLSAKAEYDVTADSTLDQGYINAEKRKAKWGESAAEYEAKIKNAVLAVKNKLIVFDNQPILAAYHAISSGNTETALNVWQTDYPYLQSQGSIGDLLAPEYLSEAQLAADAFKAKLTELGCTPSDTVTEYIGMVEKSPSGTVMKITLCGKEFTGAKIREAFGLRSAAFDIVLKENVFVFSVTGYGHGVGMSQFGADYMAKQGSTYQEIILNYYKGVKIIDL